MVWDPTRISPRSWTEVVAFYRNLEDRNDDFRPLRELAQQVLARPYASSIGAATSGTALLVTPRAVALLPSAAAATEALRLDVDMSGSVRLSAPASEARSAAVVEGALMESFERVLRKAGWIGPGRGHPT